MELSLDTASERASIALSEHGRLLGELTWICRANHSAEVLPAIDRLLALMGVSRQEIQVVFACRGPGSYGGLRAGLSLAMALAMGLGIDVLGVGRLEIEAFQQAGFPGPICPVHRAGRGDLAWAAYVVGSDDIQEIEPPQLGSPEDLVERAPAGSLFCGEVDAELTELLLRRCRDARVISGNSSMRRAATLAELAWRRYDTGARAVQGYVEPLYLREPQITTARPRRGWVSGNPRMSAPEFRCETPAPECANAPSVMGAALRGRG